MARQRALQCYRASGNARVSASAVSASECKGGGLLRQAVARASGRQGLQLADVAQFGGGLLDVTASFPAGFIGPDAKNLTIAVSIGTSKMERNNVIDLKTVRKIDQSTTCCAVGGLRPKPETASSQSATRHKAGRPRAGLAYRRRGLAYAVIYAAQH